jgi:hypothetical protein
MNENDYEVVIGQSSQPPSPPKVDRILTLREGKRLYHRYVDQYQDDLKIGDWVAILDNDYSTARSFKTHNEAFDYYRGRRVRYCEEYRGPTPSTESVESPHLSSLVFRFRKLKFRTESFLSKTFDISIREPFVISFTERRNDLTLDWTEGQLISSDCIHAMASEEKNPLAFDDENDRVLDELRAILQPSAFKQLWVLVCAGVVYCIGGSGLCESLFMDDFNTWETRHTRLEPINTQTETDSILCTCSTEEIPSSLTTPQQPQDKYQFLSETPLQTRHSRPWYCLQVENIVAGQPPFSLWVWFLLDTGSKWTYLHPEVRALLTSDVVRWPVMKANVDGLQIPIRRSESIARVRNINLLGTNFLWFRRLVIDGPMLPVQTGHISIEHTD